MNNKIRHKYRSRFSGHLKMTDFFLTYLLCWSVAGRQTNVFYSWRSNQKVPGKNPVCLSPKRQANRIWMFGFPRILNTLCIYSRDSVFVSKEDIYWNSKLTYSRMKTLCNNYDLIKMKMKQYHWQKKTLSFK